MEKVYVVTKWLYFTCKYDVELYKNWKTVIDKERGRIDTTMFHMMVLYYRRRTLLNVKF